MLHKLKISVAALLTCMVLFTACTKDGEAPGTDLNAYKNLLKIGYEDGSFDTVLYHPDGKIQTLRRVDKNGPNQQTVNLHFAYNGNLLSEIKSDDASKFVYSYQGQRLDKLEFFSSDGTLTMRYEFSYTQDKLSTMDVFYKSGNTMPANPTLRNELEYYADGNLKKLTVLIRQQGTNQLAKSSEYVIESYDAKNNTVSLFESNPFLPILLNKNNPLSEKHYNATGDVTATVAHTYTYDESGNPLTRKTVTKTVGLPEDTEHFTFKY